MKNCLCKYCGESGFYWRKDSEGAWKLCLDGTEDVHECPKVAEYKADRERKAILRARENFEQFQKYKRENGYLA